MKTYTYIDNSNVFIEGQRVSAVKQKMALDIYDAIERSVFDFSWQPDYSKLYDFVCGDKSLVGCAKLWGSPPPSDKFWEMVKRNGFDVKTYNKSISGKEKKVDVAIAHQLTKDSYTIIDREDSEIYLVAGYKDFVPVIEDLVANGFNVSIVFWNHAAKELKSVASNFISLDKWINHLSK